MSVRLPRAHSACPPLRVLALMVAGAALLGAGGCQSSTAPSDEGEETSSTREAGYPLTIDNCGAETSLEAAPQRVVTVKSAATELVLALDRADVLVGTSFADGPLPKQWADVDVPVLAEQLPSSEVVLAAEPDLVIAGWESNFSAEGVGERDDLDQLGIANYVLPAACQEPEYQPDPLTFDDVFAQITQVGELLDAREEASTLVAQQREVVAGIDASAEHLTALWYSSGSETPFVGGGIGAPELIMQTAGLENIHSGLDDTWASVSWESVAAAEPDVIVLVDSAWNTAEHKREVLASNPVTAALDAVANERYLVVPFPASEAGVRTASAAADLADQLSTLTADAG